MEERRRDFQREIILLRRHPWRNRPPIRTPKQGLSASSPPPPPPPGRPNHNHNHYYPRVFLASVREKQRGGGKTQGRGKHTIKPLPKNGFGPPPHLWYDFPPPFVYAMSFSWEETGTNQTNPTFWGLQNWFWRGGFMVRFPPPQNRTIRSAPPFANSQRFWWRTKSAMDGASDK